MDAIYTYFADLPPKINEIVTPCADGYTIYIDEKLGEEGRLNAYRHALLHIARHDFERSDVQTIEEEAHRER